MNSLPYIIIFLFIVFKGQGQSEQPIIENNWIHQAYEENSFPGTELYNAHQDFQLDSLKSTIIVAIIDMPVEINLPQLKNQIWINDKEIPGNNVDDDKNGYIDDVNGWNFLGKKDGGTQKFTQYESSRILKEFTKDSTIFLSSQPAFINAVKKDYKARKKKAESFLEYADMVYTNHKNAKKRIDSIFNHSSYTVKQLDSLKKHPESDSLTRVECLKLINFKDLGYTSQVNEERMQYAQNRINKILNIDYDDRIALGDFGGEAVYGNACVNCDSDFLTHGTYVAGMFNTSHLYNLDSLNLFQNIKIMPLVVASYGDENDKDIANAVYYAVNNGARVINMSFGKELSFKEHIVDKALRYAEEKDVLIVTAAGNSRENQDIIPHFPNDYEDEEEIFSNIINVGGVSTSLEDGFIYKYTNYGKRNVDLLGPAANITTLNPDGTYKMNQSGTSYAAPIISGISALLLLKYPQFKPWEIKKILIETGDTFNTELVISAKGKKRVTVPFMELSKSGKFVNAYNAFAKAEQLSKSNSE